jgi:hypothetical protein
VAVGVSVQQVRCGGEPAGPASLGDLAAFRCAFYDCLTLRADALCELADAVLCAEGPVSTLVGLTVTAEHRRGHGALYDGLGSGRIQVERLRRSLASLPVPRDGQGRITLAVDVSPWLRPDAATSPDRSFCHVYGRGKGQAQMIPGWPYSFVAALEPGRTSWTTLLDAVRLGPCDDATTVTATQLREVVGRLQQAGWHKPGDADILIVFDAGYDVTRLAHLLADLPVELLGRLRSDRVFCSPPPPRTPTTLGRPPRHGREFKLADPATQPEPNTLTRIDTSRYGTAEARARKPAAPPTDPPRHLGRPRRAAAHHHRQHHSTRGAAASRQPQPQTALAVVLAPTSPNPRRTGSGKHSCAGSTWNTPSGSSNKPWAGPDPASAPPTKATAGPGSSSAPTPSSGWPATSPATYADPGRNPSPNPTA